MAGANIFLAIAWIVEAGLTSRTGRNIFRRVRADSPRRRIDCIPGANMPHPPTAGGILESKSRPAHVFSPLPGGARALSPLQREILNVLLYFDIFGHPLTLEELHAFLPVAATPAEILRACSSAPLDRRVALRGAFIQLADAPGSQLAERLRKEERAQPLLRLAPLVGALISCFPWVRGVCISGELSKGIASPGADIDIFIVAAERRVWICRTILVLFKKIVLLNRKKFFCINHLVCDGHMQIREETYYSAIEAVTLRPLFNPALRERYLRANPWIGKLLPNLPLPAESGAPVRRRRIQRLVERLAPAAWLDRLDARLMERWRSAWGRRYPDMPEEQRARLYKCSPHISTAYGNDYERSIARAWEERIDHGRTGVQG